MADPADFSTERAFAFGSFRLLPTRRLLFDGETPVRLGSRALEILIALIERPGELIGKDELISRVWPSTHISEGNLKLQVAGVRRALGDGRDGRRYIQTSTGQGYRFVAAVTVINDAASAERALPTLTDKHNLPVQLTRLIGRAGVVSKLVEQFSTVRLLTIVGAGGIGKTAVAIAVAEELMPACEHGVWFIDLAPIADPRLVPTALALALRLEIRSDNPLPSLVAALGDKKMLLVLDNCEHVIEAAANLAADLLKGSRGVRILATSREPLRVEGEHVHRLSTLGSPSASVRISAAEALRFPAVQLFVERAAANVYEFELRDADAPSVGDICRKLDGIPLAIEFAAARVDTFGVRSLAAGLDDRLRLLTGSRRTARARHRTMSAALDWSYQLLGPQEQTVLRRLAIFAGGFTMKAAVAVAGTDGSSSDIAYSVADLAAKSLIAADVGDGDVRFRVLETTRAYALAKLEETGETDVLSGRHATYYRDFLESVCNGSAGEDLAAACVPEIDNIRAALTWAFGQGGDRSIAVALAAASAPIWLEMSLLTECHSWMGKALALLDDTDRGARGEMVLQNALGFSLMFTQGASSRAHAALARANEIAESVQDFDYQLRALTGLTLFCLRRQEFRSALAFARRSESIAKGAADPVAVSTADSILSASLLSLGEYAEALTYARRAHRRTTPAMRRAQIVRSGIDHSIHSHCIIAHVLWLQGLLDQCTQTTQDALADAETVGHPMSLCFALVWCGCTVSIGRGDLDTAENSIARLKDLAEKHGLGAYYASSLGFEGQLAARRGDFAAGERLLRASLDGLRETRYEVHYGPFLASLAEVLAAASHLDESLAAVDEALARAVRSDAFWWMPELLRVKGEVLLSLADTTAAADHFHRSLDLAHRQGALSWELRAAMSLGRLDHAHGRLREARHRLGSVYERFTEGFETPDLQAARRLLEEWTPGRANGKS